MVVSAIYMASAKRSFPFIYPIWCDPRLQSDRIYTFKAYWRNIPAGASAIPMAIGPTGGWEGRGARIRRQMREKPRNIGAGACVTRPTARYAR